MYIRNGQGVWEQVQKDMSKQWNAAMKDNLEYRIGNGLFKKI